MKQCGCEVLILHLIWPRLHFSLKRKIVCGCSTCHVYIEQGEDFLPEMSDREEEYVDRARDPKYNSRLACQCRLSGGGDIIVIVPDQSGIIGH